MRQPSRKMQEIIGNWRLIWKEPLLLVFIIAIFYFLLVFVAFPLYMVFKASLIVDKQFDLSNYLAIFSKRYYFQPFINSMILGILAATAAFSVSLSRISFCFLVEPAASPRSSTG